MMKKEKRSAVLIDQDESLIAVALAGYLCLHKSRYEEIKVGGIDITDGEDAQVMRHRLVDGKPRLRSRVHRVHGATGSLGKKDRNLMLMDGEEE